VHHVVSWWFIIARSVCSCAAVNVCLRMICVFVDVFGVRKSWFGPCRQCCCLCTARTPGKPTAAADSAAQQAACVLLHLGLERIYVVLFEMLLPVAGNARGRWSCSQLSSFTCQAPSQLMGACPACDLCGSLAVY
jgi:hypothetical protein